MERIEWRIMQNKPLVREYLHNMAVTHTHTNTLKPAPFSDNTQ